MWHWKHCTGVSPSLLGWLKRGGVCVYVCVGVSKGVWYVGSHTWWAKEEGGGRTGPAFTNLDIKVSVEQSLSLRLKRGEETRLEEAKMESRVCFFCTAQLLSLLRTVVLGFCFSHWFHFLHMCGAICLNRQRSSVKLLLETEWRKQMMESHRRCVAGLQDWP